MSKLHYHKLTIACLIDRLCKVMTTLHFNTNAGPERSHDITYSRDLIWKNGPINGHYYSVSGLAFNEGAILSNPQCPIEAHMV